MDALLSEAVKTRDYRLAIRYRYLQLLRYLSRSGRIDYHPEKTNWDYLAEISDSRLKVAFSKASRVYEYTWYGEQAVDQHGYEGIEHLFDPARETNHQRHE